MENYPKSSQIISSQLPNFVRADHPMFVSFLEAYYEWLDEKDDFQGGLNLLSQRDVDSTIDTFIDYFKKEYLLNFPENLARDVDGNPLNQRKLIKNIRQFFRAKGSEKSYNFLFRILYNSSTEFYYPKEDILRLSDGRWVERTSIKTTANNKSDLFALLQQEIKQRNDSGEVTAYARVTDIQLYPIDGVEVAEFFIAGVFGEFVYGKNIEGWDADGELLLKEFVFPVLSNITIKDGGKDYQPGETIYLKPKNTSEYPVGSGFLARIEEVDTQNSLYKTDEEIQLGTIKKLRIVDFGFNYTNLDDWVVVVNSPFGTDATFEVSTGGMSKYPGYYEGSSGQLSSNKKIQDSHYYQQFSYVLKVEASYDGWIDTIKKIIHPAGMEVFGEVLLYRRRIDTIDGSHNELHYYENPLIGHYTPYRFETHENLRNNSMGVDLYPQGYNPYACSVTGGYGRGTVSEYGTNVHNPYNVPIGQTQFTGPLYSNIDDILGHNSHCPDTDVNNLEHGTEGCSGGWSECEFTPFAQSDGNDGFGCCTNADYWIIYPHPNSRNIEYIPPTIEIKRIWFHNDGDIETLPLPLEIHEKIHQNIKEENIYYDRVTGSDLRPFYHQQPEVEIGTIVDVEEYPLSSVLTVTGSDGVTQVHVSGRLDVISDSDSFMDEDYEGLTGYSEYYLESQYTDINISIGENNIDAIDDYGKKSSVRVSTLVTVEDVVIPNPFIHIILNDFLHMPITTGVTGNDPYQYRSTNYHDLSYKQVR
jgi:hypothetical protein